MHLKMSRTWAASVNLLLFLIDGQQFLSWFPGAVWGSEMGSLEKIVGIETLCRLFFLQGEPNKSTRKEGQL